jgi:hypothetical protein
MPVRIDKTSRITSLALAGLLASVQILQAQQVIIPEPYEFFDPAVANADQACRKIATSSLGKSAEGLNSISYRMPDTWESNLPDVRIFNYGGVVFGSDYGKATGQMICVVDTKGRRIMETVFTFDGKGLAGFKPVVPGKPRSESFRSMTASLNITPITGIK